MDKHVHQLMIIGNGFDLACGLRSSFSDFFATRYDKDGNCLLSPDGLTAWDIILSGVEEDDPLWCDVEAIVAKWAVGEDGHGQLTRALGSVFPEEGLSAPREELLAAVDDIAKNVDYHLYVIKSRGTYPGNNGMYEEAFEFLLSELHRFERAFADYLSGQVVSSALDYSRAAERGLTLLACDSSRSPSGGALKVPLTSVINFNYTWPPYADPSSCWSNIEIRNVHGSLGSGDIVIGIDGKDIKDDSLALPFTKTYRLLALEPIEHGSLVHPAGSECPTNCIKFYGHSLAEADYSYFQAIFDDVDLYGSDVALIFYYSGYKDSSGKDIPDGELRGRQYKMVSHLLTAYGKTLDNSAHGDNLMHKLLLEGRLSIKRLEIA